MKTERTTHSRRGYASILFVAAIFFWSASSNVDAQQNQCAIASAHPLASEAGCEILAQGGNAFDAAVAVTAALAVVEPYSSGLGGGGFYLMHRASDGFEVFLDARETAPAEATASRFLDEDGNALPELSRSGATAAGIPEYPLLSNVLLLCTGACHLQRRLHRRFASPSKGFRPIPAMRAYPVGWQQNSMSIRARPPFFSMTASRSSWAMSFVNPSSARPYAASSLKARAFSTAARFAQDMVRSVRSNGGFWTMDDLAAYRVVEREPQRFQFHGARITTAPLPSSGGLVMAQTLQIVDSFPIRSMSQDDRTHVVVEAMRRAYNDRARFMGDADFVNVPVEKLASSKYARKRAQTIDLNRATPSSELPSVDDPAEEGEDTTHFSIVDSDGIGWPRRYRSTGRLAQA